MRMCPRSSLLCILALMILSDTAECIFFHYPKRAIMDFLENLGGHKQAKSIHHYHMHYYPWPVPVPKIAPLHKVEIDLSPLHSSHDRLHSLGWPSQDFGKVHQSETLYPSIHQESSWTTPLPGIWPDHTNEQQNSWGWSNNEILEKDQAYKEAKAPGILLQVPLKQQIVLYQPPAKDIKSSLLSTFFKKLWRVNNALFQPEDDTSSNQQNYGPHVSTSLTYGA